MSLRPLVLLCCASLLVACSSEAPKPEQTPQPTVTSSSPLANRVPLPAFQRALNGTLLGAPAGAEVELALLVIDERGRPQTLLASDTLTGTNQALPFQLRFNPESFPLGTRVELRGRVSKSGQLISRLTPRRIQQPTTQVLGQLQFESMP